MIKKAPGVAAYVLLADFLRAAIEDGTYGPGDRIPSLGQLASAHDIAPDTARKAVAILRAEGLLEVVQGYGTRVPIPEDEADLTVVALPRASRCRIRKATAAERKALGIESGGRVLEVRTGARIRIYAEDRSLFTTS